MSQTRRGFLGTVAAAGAAVLCGEEVLEAFARLTHVRKSFPSAGLSPTFGSFFTFDMGEAIHSTAPTTEGLAVWTAHGIYTIKTSSPQHGEWKVSGSKLAFHPSVPASGIALWGQVPRYTAYTVQS